MGRMTRRDLLRGALGLVGAAVLPLPKGPVYNGVIGQWMGYRWFYGDAVVRPVYAISSSASQKFLAAKLLERAYAKTAADYFLDSVDPLAERRRTAYQALYVRYRGSFG